MSCPVTPRGDGGGASSSSSFYSSSSSSSPVNATSSPLLFPHPTTASALNSMVDAVSFAEVDTPAATLVTTIPVCCLLCEKKEETNRALQKKIKNLQAQVEKFQDKIKELKAHQLLAARTHTSSPTTVAENVEQLANPAAPAFPAAPAASTEENKMEKVGQMVLRTVEEAGTLTTIVHGNATLSFAAGLCCEELRSSCGCSSEKMPQIITMVITMLFGKLPEKYMQKLVKSHATYARCIERTMKYLQDDLRHVFDPVLPRNDAFEQVCLCMDASKKGNHNLVIKLAVGQCEDGFVRMKALSTDMSVSKKAENGKELSLPSILSEIGQVGALKLTSACVDVFGVSEMKQIMDGLDDLRISNTYLHNPALRTPSDVVPGLFYSYAAGRVGGDRIRTCLMHACERVLRRLLELLLQKQGQAHTATESQNLFSIAYYMRKFKEQFQNMNMTLNSTSHAFPSITYMELQTNVCNAFIKAGKSPKEVSAITGTMGLTQFTHPALREELRKIASGQLRTHLQQATGWVVGDPVKSYFVEFKAFVPAISESLQKGNGHVLIASTVGEQGFSIANYQMHANSSKETVKQNMHYALNIKKGISSEVRYMRTNNTDDATNIQEDLPDRLFRNTSTRSDYAHKLIDRSHELDTAHAAHIVSYRSLHQRSKRGSEMLESAPHVMNEFKKNKLNRHQIGGSEEIMETIQAFTSTGLSDKTALPEKERSEYEQIAYNNKLWKAETIRTYLLATNLPEYTTVPQIRYQIRGTDPEGYKDLRMLLVEYWQTQSTSIEEVQNVTAAATATTATTA